MRVLLQHPNDEAEIGPWAKNQWDLIVDFGWSGKFFYSQLSQKRGCRVLNYRALLAPECHRDGLRQILRVGLGSVVDNKGVDWWDIFLGYASSRIEDAMLMSALAEEVKNGAEIWATRPHFLAQMLEMLLNRKIASFLEGEPASLATRLRGVARDLRFSQVAEIALDKWDVDYRWRRLVSRKTAPSATPVILLPSAYGNVSRAQASYARLLPDCRFLQVVTRRSGRIAALPSNVEVRSLAGYTLRPFSQATESECDQLMEDWRRFEHAVLRGHRELGVAREVGAFASFAPFLRKGLRVRDAWLSIFQKESVVAVLSADDHNPYTRLPVVLANSRKLPTIFCDHGGLNVGPAVRAPCSDHYLARGEMARDYWVNWCGLPSARVTIGASQETAALRVPSSVVRDSLVFFSEPYELESGRTGHFYGEVLPALCSVAGMTGHRVIVKLHPFESLRARRRMIYDVLSGDQRSLVEVVDGPLTAGLLARAWCGVSVSSSVAVECALQGIPCFLCHWHDCSWIEYGRQFEKFSAAKLLNSPHEILKIPHYIESFEPSESVRRKLETAINPEQLKAVLCGPRAASLTVAPIR